MIRHIVVFSFADHVSDDDRRQLLDELDQLPRTFSAMRNWTSGPNRSRRDDTYQHAFVVDFDTEDELVAYLNSDVHEAFVAQRWKPAIASRAIVSFEVEGQTEATTPDDRASMRRTPP